MSDVVDDHGEIWDAAVRESRARATKAQPEPISGEVLPCPFCGGTLLGRQEGELRTDGQAGEPAKVVCGDCDASVIAYSLSDAIIKWNRRAILAKASA